MKKLLTLILIVAFASVAYGANLYTASNTTDNIVMPSGGGFPTVYAINFTGGAATADLIFYQGDNTTALCSEGKAASATTFVLDSCTGIDDSDIVVIQQRHTGTPLEVATVSACDDTTEIVTIASGTANAFNGTRGFQIFEMKTLTTWADVGTTRLNLEGRLVQGDTRIKPLAAIINGTGGTFHYMTGGYE